MFQILIQQVQVQFLGVTVTSNGSPYAVGPLSVLSVCNVGVLWPNGWMEQDATWYKVGLGPGHIL